MGFFLKISSSSGIISSVSFNELNSSDCWRDDDEFSWTSFYFIVVCILVVYMAKNIRGFLENLTDYFLIWNLNITEHYPEILLQVNVK